MSPNYPIFKNLFFKELNIEKQHWKDVPDSFIQAEYTSFCEWDILTKIEELDFIQSVQQYLEIQKEVISKDLNLL